VLLPMHLPVLLCGLLCGPYWGLVCGVATPLLSSVLTGMPPAYPMLPIMLAQLAVIGLVGGLLHGRLGKHLFLSIPAAVLSGWAAYGLVFAALLLGSGGQLKALSVTGALAMGIPGLVLQFTVVPLLVKLLLRRFPALDARRRAEDPMLRSARAVIKSGLVSCIVIKDGVIAHAADGRGVAPLLDLYKSKPELVRDAFVVDKIIGKAGAMIVAAAGAKAVYAEIMSFSARDYLKSRGILGMSGRSVDVISDRDGNGICPIEKSVFGTEDPIEGIACIERRFRELRGAV